jgi:hypothetical protein
MSDFGFYGTDVRHAELSRRWSPVSDNRRRLLLTDGFFKSYYRARSPIDKQKVAEIKGPTEVFAIAENNSFNRPADKRA